MKLPLITPDGRMYLLSKDARIHTLEPTTEMIDGNLRVNGCRVHFMNGDIVETLVKKETIQEYLYGKGGTQ